VQTSLYSRQVLPQHPNHGTMGLVDKPVDTSGDGGHAEQEAPHKKRFVPMCPLAMAGNCLAVQEAAGTAGDGSVALTGGGQCGPQEWMEILFRWRARLFTRAAVSAPEPFDPFLLASVCKAWRFNVLAVFLPLMPFEKEKERLRLAAEWESVEQDLQGLLDRVHHRLDEMVARGVITTWELLETRQTVLNWRMTMKETYESQLYVRDCTHRSLSFSGAITQEECTLRCGKELWQLICDGPAGHVPINMDWHDMFETAI